MTLFAVFAFAVSLAAAEPTPQPVVASIALDVRDAVLQEGPIAPLDAQETAQLLIAWSWRESRWRIGAHDPIGATWGRLQSTCFAATSSYGCDRLKTDGYAQIVAGLRYMRSLSISCGSLRSGLGAYATGKCGGAPLLVSSRLALAGIAL